MKITTVSASVRYSNGSRGGPYTTIELGAEAALGPNDTWQEAQATLYHELGQQLKTLWPVKTRVSTNGNTEHHCAEHDTPFERFHRDGRVWWAHRQAGGWHNDDR